MAPHNSYLEYIKKAVRFFIPGGCPNGNIMEGRPSQIAYIKYVKDAVKRHELLLFLDRTDEEKEELVNIAREEQQKLFKFENKNSFKTARLIDINLIENSGDEIEKKISKVLWSEEVTGSPKLDKIPALEPISEILSPPTGRLIIFDNLSCRNNNEDRKALEDVSIELKKWKKLNPYSKLIVIMFALKDKNHFDNLPEVFFKFFYDENNFFDQFREVPQVKDADSKLEESLATEKEIDTQKVYVFRKDGERWYIKFENELLKPEDLDGLKYIHYLMESYYQKSITPNKLYHAVKGIKTLDKDVNSSVKTYSVELEEIDESTLEELNKLNGSSSDKSSMRKSKMTQSEKEHERYTKGEIKMIVEGWKKNKETLKNKAAELKEEGRLSEAEVIEKEIKDKQKQIDVATRQEHDKEHKRFYDMVSKAIDNAKKKIKKLSIKEGYKSSLIWNHFEDSIDYKSPHYSYNPKKLIDWEF